MAFQVLVVPVQKEDHDPVRQTEEQEQNDHGRISQSFLAALVLFRFGDRDGDLFPGLRGGFSRQCRFVRHDDDFFRFEIFIFPKKESIGLGLRIINIRRLPFYPEEINDEIYSEENQSKNNSKVDNIATDNILKNVPKKKGNFVEVPVMVNE